MIQDVEKIKNQTSKKIEEKILKAIFKRNDAILDVVDIITPSMFSEVDYSHIYDTMLDLYKKGANINSETVEEHSQTNRLDVNPNIIKKLYNESYTALKIKDSALILKELYIRRVMLNGLTTILDDQEQSPTTSTSILDKINDLALRCNDYVSQEKKVDNKCCSDVEKILEDIDTKLLDLGKNDGIKVGIPVIDDELEGLCRKRLWTIVADSQVGKSALAIQLAVQALMHNPDINVSYYSLEMDKQEVEERALSNITDIEPRFLSNPIKYFSKFNPKTQQIEVDITEDELIEFKDNIRCGAETLKKLNFYIDDTADLDIVSLEAKIKKNHLRWGKTDIIIVDHTGILCDGSPSEVVGKMDIAYNKFKQIAKKLDCVFISLHQFSNELKNDPVRFPNVFSLRGSAAPRHYSDVIMGIYRPSVYPDVIKNYPELEDVCQLVWQKVRYTAKPMTTEMKYNGFKFIQSIPTELKGDVISGNVYLDSDGELIGEDEYDSLCG
jgi:replicative DNA helicase